jgi:isoleucyl-tRNA synthetase
LIAEGFAYEIVRAIQNRRKEMNCRYTDRIAVGIVTDSAELHKAINDFALYIARETLTAPGQLAAEPVAGVDGIELNLAGHAVTLYVKVLAGNDQ